MKILIVDDDEFCRQMLRQFAEYLGISVLEARSAEEGKAVFDTNFHAEADVEVVISDLEMEENESGIDMLRHVYTVSPRVRLCLVSGNLSEKSAKKAWEIGALVATKPYDSIAQLLKNLGCIGEV